jgi:uncharacterized protein YaiI (UPF0178 family)
MTIWVDADACPRLLKDILYRTAQRRQRPLILVAHQSLQIPASIWIRRVQVEPGIDAADHYIEAQISAGELLISNDIPLAAAVVDKGAETITTRGDLLDRNNIRERLKMRDLMEELRGIGQLSGGPPPLDNTDKARFANALDRWLSKHPAP